MIVITLDTPILSLTLDDIGIAVYSFGSLEAQQLVLDRELERWREWIGLRVRKAKTRFKSRLHVNTVRDVTVSPYTGRPAFQFEEDNSIVECRVCHMAYPERLVA